MVNTVGSYGAGAYAQTAIQEKLSGQRPQQGEERTTNAAQTNREELFKSLLKTTDSKDAQASDGRRVQADPSGGRGQFLDLSV